MAIEGKKARLYVQFWDALTNDFEWRAFDEAELESLVELGIVTVDSLCAALTDQAAFDEALLHMSEIKRPWSIVELAEYYWQLTDAEIRIKA